MREIRMWKRAVAAILGLLSLVSALAGAELAMMAVDDLRNPEVQTSQAVIGVALLSFLVAAALVLSIRFLYFALFGKSNSRRRRSYSIFLGSACCIPGFFFSLPLTLWVFCKTPGGLCADHLAFLTSALIGAASAIAGCFALLRQKRGLTN
jgi:hypothetical protein